jgi:hypothetical protein
MISYPTLPCRMCGKESLDCVDYASIHKEAQVCGRCADIVSNVFSMKHSGRYLTWPNEILPSRYRERKNISAKIRKAVMERDKYRCVKCESFVDLQIDHVYPHSKGGSDELDNLQTLCASCNRIKKDKVDG